MAQAPKKTPKRGRPPLPKGSARTHIIQVRVTGEQKVLFEDRAAQTQESVSDWLRRVALRAAWPPRLRSKGSIK